MKPAFQVEFDEHGASYRVRRVLRAAGGKARGQDGEIRAAPPDGLRPGMLAAFRKGLMARGRRQGSA